MKTTTPKNYTLELESVRIPVIGKRYHTSWSKNPFMTWTLVSVYPDGRCLLGSKLSRFETQLTDLRISRMIKHRPANKAKQLELSFMNKLKLQ